jgi:hypothetical protein
MGASPPPICPRKKTRFPVHWKETEIRGCQLYLGLVDFHVPTFCDPIGSNPGQAEQHIPEGTTKQRALEHATGPQSSTPSEICFRDHLKLEKCKTSYSKLRNRLRPNTLSLKSLPHFMY